MRCYLRVANRILVWPDVHTPNHNTNAVNAALSYIKVYKPTQFIQLGDFCDWDSFTSYDPRRQRDIVNVEEEVVSANKLLDELDALLPKSCKKDMIGWNHEARVPKYLAKHGMDTQHQRLAKKIRSWHEAYRLDERGWGHIEYGEVLEVGKILFSHGWFTGGSHAKKHLALYHKCLIYGHTHEFQVATENGFDGHPVMAASIGTLSNFDLSYLVGKPPVNWINMFMTIDVMEDGTFTPNFIPLINGRFVKGGIVYGV